MTTTLMPQPQDTATPGPEDTEGYTVDLESEINDVEEQPDGSAIVHLGDLEGPSEDQDFYANMADELDSWDLSKMAFKYIDLFEKDRQAREERDKKYEEGLRRTGMGDDAPGGANFQGASKVVHPVMAEACIILNRVQSKSYSLQMVLCGHTSWAKKTKKLSNALSANAIS